MSSFGGAAAAAGGVSSTAGTKMFITPECTAVSSTLGTLLDATAKPRSMQFEARISDFDGVHWRIQAPVDVSFVDISIVMPYWKELPLDTIATHLRAVYGDLLVPPVDGASVTLRLVPASLPAPLEAVIASAALLRQHIMAAPFDAAFKRVAAGSSEPNPEVVVRYRDAERIYILPRKDRVAVVFSLHAPDETDRAVARIIGQEFVDAQRMVSTAPPVSFSDKEPPAELRPYGLPPASGTHVGFLTFSLFPRNFDSDAKRTNAMNMLTNFHIYLDFHIKAAKAHLHLRMRARVDGWMQVLNRAHPEDPFTVKEKKLATGRTFIKK